MYLSLKNASNVVVTLGGVCCLPDKSTDNGYNDLAGPEPCNILLLLFCCKWPVVRDIHGFKHASALTHTKTDKGGQREKNKNIL